ncbi:uncharacterized protein LOC121236567 [Juglans microcarpa x Juglans regia]|uniref:uncharacterized protein LOC121236567 n=1 Tax=Juglans microcarpa x Juglans regia TaxID=2249226 RepID=UPI001B7F542A|nr:uncharacterized protein LOC121236567 [Juglans microcarpa x Juglans regia]
MVDGQHDAPPCTLKDYVRPVVNDNYSGIRRQTINANNFELKPALINMVQQAQFSGSPLDDPNIHLAMFLEIRDTVKINDFTEYTIRLRLFPFSLRDKARSWLQFLQPRSITSWQDMAEKFLAKFFPPTKKAKLRSEIGLFKQNDFESLYEAWERTMAKKVAGIHELEPLAALSAQVATLSHHIPALTTQRIPQSAEYVAVTNMTIPSNEVSQEQVQYINNRSYNYRGNPMPNYYHPGLRNHENLSYRNTKNVLQPPPGFDSQQS